MSASRNSKASFTRFMNMNVIAFFDPLKTLFTRKNGDVDGTCKQGLNQ